MIPEQRPFTGTHTHTSSPTSCSMFSRCGALSPSSSYCSSGWGHLRLRWTQATTRVCRSAAAATDRTIAPCLARSWRESCRHGRAQHPSSQRQATARSTPVLLLQRSPQSMRSPPHPSRRSRFSHKRFQHHLPNSQRAAAKSILTPSAVLRSPSLAETRRS
jgi:hypothetical protein